MKSRYLRIISLLLTFVLMIVFASCGGSTSGADNSSAPWQSKADKKEESKADTSSSAADGESRTDNTQSGSSAAVSDNSMQSENGGSQINGPQSTSAANKTLVVYFSATGTTRGVAQKIAAAAEADVYEIKAAQEYTSADLNWHDSSSRTTKEQNDKSARPAISSAHISLSGYKTVYIGYPIWWGEEPRIMDTFAESYDFTGIKVIPFCTSGGSGIGRSGQNLAGCAKSGTWLEGRRFSSGVSESELSAWIAGFN